ncbi:hypothetical protein LDENG_00222210 [Lucifuga dentata]|nr:hypothetical protein LDENG_00222210 [Lucifuga dentata]
MSNRDSLGYGDLLPKDVVEIFAQEKHIKMGRKKRSHSLGRALGWLKGKKKKDLSANGQSLGLGPALDLALDAYPVGHQGRQKGSQKAGKQASKQVHPQGISKGITKQYDEKTQVPPLFQENVFIEASRPKYLEDLHTEALEGLKMMQQEETNNGMDYQDDESTISNATVQPEPEGDTGGFMSDSTIPDTSSVVSAQSSVSTRSSRSGLTRQGSTFRPLSSGKKTEKSKTRRRNRKTVVGIPHHVQRELGLDRVEWTTGPVVAEEQLLNGETNNSPSTDGTQQAANNQKGANASLQNTDVLQTVNEGKVEQFNVTHAGHKDDLALLHRLGPDLSSDQRPRSLAVPWMTTANSLQQEPPNPVMSMSPQAAYLSKIIPNAVMPPSIDVVEISRGRSRNSVRTVSKSSLLLASPASSRASSRTSSSRASTVTSASRSNPPNVSDSSCWSNSESSDTLVSNSSTISSSSTPRQKGSQDRIVASAKEDSVHSSSSKASRCTSNGKFIHKGNEVKKKGPFARTSMDSPSYNADTSSLDDSTGSVSVSPIKPQTEESVPKETSPEKQLPVQDNKLKKTISPSSGYSSQDGTPPHASKQSHSSSPKYKRGILAKLQSLFPGPTHAPSISAPSPFIKPNTKPAEHPKLQPNSSVDTVVASPSVRALREVFNIPPPPNIHAPPPPPPEAWFHNKRTFELLLGAPAPNNIYAVVKKNPKDRRQQRQSPLVSRESSVKSLSAERKQKNLAYQVESGNGSLHILETKKDQESEILNAEVHKENNERLAYIEQQVDMKGTSKVTEKDEKARVSELLNEMLVKAVEKRGERLAAMNEDNANTHAQTSVTEVKTKMDMLSAISLVRISPSPSPPPSHHPPDPPNKWIAYASKPPDSAPATEIQALGSSTSDVSWPPPPPPMEQASVTLLSGNEEVEFPLPPPPICSEEVLAVSFEVPPEKTNAEQLCTRTATSATLVVNTESLQVATEAPPQIPSPAAKLTYTSQWIPPPPLSIPPPPCYAAPPPPAKQITPAITKKEVSLTSTKDVLPPLVKEVSPLPPKETSAPPAEEVAPPSGQEKACPPSEETTSSPVSKLFPSQSIPPPPSNETTPPLQSEPPPSGHNVHVSHESIPAEPETNLPSWSSILTPPQSIPPPPPSELLPPSEVPPPNTDHVTAQETPPSPASETLPSLQKAPEPTPSSINMPLPPPLPVQTSDNIKHEPSPLSTENQSQEQTSPPDIQEEPTPIVTPFFLKMDNVRSVSSSPEPTKPEDQAQTEVTMRIQAPTQSTSGEAPQKPIRRSLIVTSPTSTSPPATLSSQPAVPKSPATVVPPSTSPTAFSPTKKSPPAVTISPSMNLQEAIRLRTAARSKDGRPSRLSLHSPTSPLGGDLCKSTSSTASFIFSKSNKKMTIEPTSPTNVKGNFQKTVANKPSFVTKSVSEPESPKKEIKVPPPVAKKPKTKTKEIQQTARQEARPESNKGPPEKQNGTAGTVEGGRTLT